LYSGEVDGIPQNLDKTRDWAAQAAEQDNGFGHYILGALYKDGLGVQRDLVIAYMRYLLSERAGFEGGDGRLRPIAEDLSAAQLLEAQALKDQCIERDFQECSGRELVRASSQSVNTKSENEAGIDPALEARAQNHLVCMAAYSNAVAQCSNIAAFKRAAEDRNSELAELEQFAATPFFSPFGTLTASDFIETCIGEETGDVFGNSDAVERVTLGLSKDDNLPNDENPDEVYDWVEADLGDEVQKMVDRIYAEPDVDAPQYLERPLGRAVGHMQRGQQLLIQAGSTESEAVDMVVEYERSGGGDLTGQHPDNQSTIYKIKACLDLL
jgi:hypothetical protein